MLESPLPEWVTPPFLPYLALFDKGEEEIELFYNEYPRGVNMAYPRQSFREVGLFSTAFGLKGRSLRCYDEIELCYRLERLGRRILYTPGAEVNHAFTPSGSRWPGSSSGFTRRGRPRPTSTSFTVGAGSWSAA